MLERFYLLAGFFGYVRMTVANADGDDTSKAIQVSGAFFIEHILHRSFNNHYRILVIGDKGRGKILLSHGLDFVQGGSGVRFGLIIKRW